MKFKLNFYDYFLSVATILLVCALYLLNFSIVEILFAIMFLNIMGDAWLIRKNIEELNK